MEKATQRNQGQKVKDMKKSVLVLCFFLIGCNKEPIPTQVVTDQNMPVRTFCQDGVLYEVPKWDETGKFGFIMEGRTC